MNNPADDALSHIKSAITHLACAAEHLIRSQQRMSNDVIRHREAAHQAVLQANDRIRSAETITVALAAPPRDNPSAAKLCALGHLTKSNYWRCSCDRVHARAVRQCECGMKKPSNKKEIQNVKT